MKKFCLLITSLLIVITMNLSLSNFVFADNQQNCFYYESEVYQFVSDYYGDNLVDIFPFQVSLKQKAKVGAYFYKNSIEERAIITLANLDENTERLYFQVANHWLASSACKDGTMDTNTNKLDIYGEQYVEAFQSKHLTYVKTNEGVKDNEVLLRFEYKKNNDKYTVEVVIDLI